MLPMTSLRRSRPADLPGRSPRPRVADVMQRDVVVIPAWTTVDAITFRAGSLRRAYPVVDVSGAPIGVLDPAALGDLSACSGVTAAEMCIPLRGLHVLSPDEQAPEDAQSSPTDHLPSLVVENGRLVGVLPAPSRRLPRPGR